MSPQVRVLVFLWFTLTFPDVSICQPFQVELFDTQNGLPVNHIKTIYQDSKGFLWVGTVAGVSRFDVYNFTNHSWANGLP